MSPSRILADLCEAPLPWRVWDFGSAPSPVCCADAPLAVALSAQTAAEFTLQATRACEAGAGLVLTHWLPDTWPEDLPPALLAWLAPRAIVVLDAPHEGQAQSAVPTGTTVLFAPSGSVDGCPVSTLVQALAIAAPAEHWLFVQGADEVAQAAACGPLSRIVLLGPLTPPEHAALRGALPPGIPVLAPEGTRTSLLEQLAFQIRYWEPKIDHPPGLRRLVDLLLSLPFTLLHEEDSPRVSFACDVRTFAALLWGGSPTPSRRVGGLWNGTLFNAPAYSRLVDDGVPLSRQAFQAFLYAGILEWADLPEAVASRFCGTWLSLVSDLPFEVTAACLKAHPSLLARVLRNERDAKKKVHLSPLFDALGALLGEPAAGFPVPLRRQIAEVYLSLLQRFRMPETAATPHLAQLAALAVLDRRDEVARLLEARYRAIPNAPGLSIFVANAADLPPPAARALYAVDEAHGRARPTDLLEYAKSVEPLSFKDAVDLAALAARQHPALRMAVTQICAQRILRLRLEAWDSHALRALDPQWLEISAIIRNELSQGYGNPVGSGMALASALSFAGKADDAWSIVDHGVSGSGLPQAAVPVALHLWLRGNPQQCPPSRLHGIDQPAGINVPLGLAALCVSALYRREDLREPVWGAVTRAFNAPDAAPWTPFLRQLAALSLWAFGDTTGALAVARRSGASESSIASFERRFGVQNPEPFEPMPALRPAVDAWLRRAPHPS